MQLVLHLKRLWALCWLPEMETIRASESKRRTGRINYWLAFNCNFRWVIVVRAFACGSSSAHQIQFRFWSTLSRSHICVWFKLFNTHYRTTQNEIDQTTAQQNWIMKKLKEKKKKNDENEHRNKMTRFKCCSFVRNGNAHRVKYSCISFPAFCTLRARANWKT